MGEQGIPIHADNTGTKKRYVSDTFTSNRRKEKLRKNRLYILDSVRSEQGISVHADNIAQHSQDKHGVMAYMLQYMSRVVEYGQLEQNSHAHREAT